MSWFSSPVRYMPSSMYCTAPNNSKHLHAVQSTIFLSTNVSGTLDSCLYKSSRSTVNAPSSYTSYSFFHTNWTEETSSHQKFLITSPASSRRLLYTWIPIHLRFISELFTKISSPPESTTWSELVSYMSRLACHIQVYLVPRTVFVSLNNSFVRKSLIM